MFKFDEALHQRQPFINSFEPSPLKDTLWDSETLERQHSKQKQQQEQHVLKLQEQHVLKLQEQHVLKLQEQQQLFLKYEEHSQHYFRQQQYSQQHEHQQEVQLKQNQPLQQQNQQFPPIRQLPKYPHLPQQYQQELQFQTVSSINLQHKQEALTLEIPQSCYNGPEESYGNSMVETTTPANATFNNQFQKSLLTTIFYELPDFNQPQQNQQLSQQQQPGKQQYQSTIQPQQYFYSESLPSFQHNYNHHESEIADQTSQFSQPSLQFVPYQYHLANNQQNMLLRQQNASPFLYFSQNNIDKKITDKTSKKNMIKPRKKKRERIRTENIYRNAYSRKIKEILETFYTVDKFIGASKRVVAMKETGLSKQQINVWFQNRRAKEKKGFEVL